MFFMRRNVFIFLVLLFKVCPYQSFAQDKEGFRLIKKDNNISIYERWIHFPKPNSPTQAREVKGEFTVASNIYAALRLIKNEKRIMDWQSHVSEFKIYLKPDTLSWNEYSYHDIPWPVSDQDHYLVYKLNVIKPGQLLLITFESASNDEVAPVRQDVARMGLSGSWRLEKISSRQIKATYKIVSKPSNIPKFITDPVIRNNMMTTIKSFIDILEGRR